MNCSSSVASFHSLLLRCPTDSHPLRSSNCRSRLLARNYPVQEEVVGCEGRCGACATDKSEMAAGRIRNATAFHHPSSVGRMPSAKWPSCAASFVPSISFRLRSRAVAAVVLFVVVMLADHSGRIIGNKSHQTLPH